MLKGPAYNMRGNNWLQHGDMCFGRECMRTPEFLIVPDTMQHEKR
jgi:hypothetical protein